MLEARDGALSEEVYAAYSEMVVALEHYEEKAAID